VGQARDGALRKARQQKLCQGVAALTVHEMRPGDPAAGFVHCSAVWQWVAGEGLQQAGLERELPERIVVSLPQDDELGLGL